MEAERKRARNWYWWLWLSPLLTIPTLFGTTALFNDFFYEAICRGRYVSCDWDLVVRLSLVAAVLLSSLWHLLLLKPALDRKSPFVHWHGIQALCLAGLRTAVPLVIVTLFGEEFPSLLAIPILILIWLIGTFISQQEASRGKCSLAQLAGRGDELVAYQEIEPESKLEQEQLEAGAVQEWVNIIRFNEDPQQRRHALAQLKRLDMVEDF